MRQAISRYGPSFAAFFFSPMSHDGCCPSMPCSRKGLLTCQGNSTFQLTRRIGASKEKTT